MWKARGFAGFPRAVEREGSLLLASSFPRTVISIALFHVRRFFSLLPLFDRATETIRLRAGFQNVRAIRDAVQQGFAQPGIRDDLRPLREWQIGRKNDRRPFGAF